MECAHNAKYNKPEWIGKKFGKLTVVGSHVKKTTSGNQWYWDCKCDCGKEVSVVPGNVLIGHTTSCGCMRKEVSSITNSIHGESKSRLYIIWLRMIERCDPTQKHVKFLHRYALRGIRVCDEWHDYATFAAWAKANGYNDTLTIERIDNDGNYCPENCKWIERGKQARNRSTTLHVQYQGKEMSLAEACEIANMPYKQVFTRIKYLGWPVDKALSIPINETRKWKRSERFCKQSSFLGGNIT